MSGQHVAVRAPNFETVLAYIAPPTDDHFHIEILGGGEPTPQAVRPCADLYDSLAYAGYQLSFSI
jgi:hypothetical protein